MRYLNDEQVRDLWEAGRKTEIMETFVDLCKVIAGEIYRAGQLRETEVSYDELRSWAYEAMCMAVETWDPARGVPMSAWVSLRTKWRISDIMRRYNAQLRGSDAERISMDDLSAEEGRIEETLAPAITAEDGLCYGIEDDLIRRIDLERATQRLELTPEEEVVLDGILDGQSNEQISPRINRSRETVRKARMRIRNHFSDEEVYSSPAAGGQSGPFIELCATNARRYH